MDSSNKKLVFEPNCEDENKFKLKKKSKDNSYVFKDLSFEEECYDEFSIVKQEYKDINDLHIKDELPDYSINFDSLSTHEIKCEEIPSDAHYITSAIENSHGSRIGQFSDSNQSNQDSIDIEEKLFGPHQEFHSPCLGLREYPVFLKHCSVVLSDDVNISVTKRNTNSTNKGNVLKNDVFKKENKLQFTEKISTKQTVPKTAEFCGKEKYSKSDYSKYRMNCPSARVLNTVKEKPYKCKLCDYQSLHRSYLQKHVRNHTKQKTYQCKVCKSIFSLKSKLTRHVQAHTCEKPLFKCDICGYIAKYKSNINRHMRIHTLEKPFKCELCDFKTARKEHISMHMQKHTDEKPFKCNICDFRAARKVSLNSHLLTHTGEKPFQCKICFFKTARKANLIVHMRSHTGEKPFNCDICGYGTAYRSQLIIHMRTHTGEKPFKCEFCDYRSVQRPNVILHLRTHTDKMTVV